MENLITFLEGHLELFTWIGGIIITTFGGMWAFVKFFLLNNKEAQKNTAGKYNSGNDSKINIVGNVSGQVAVDQRIEQRIEKFVSKILVLLVFIGLILILIVVIIIIINRISNSNERIPRSSVSITCGEREGPYFVMQDGTLVTDANQNEIESLMSLYNLAQKYRDQIVLVSVSIESESGHKCFRLEKRRPGTERSIPGRDSSSHIDLKEVDADWGLGEVQDFYLVNAMDTDKWAATQGFFFPPQNYIPENKFYKKKYSTRGRTLIDYEGPFIVRSDYDTGYGYVALYPIKDFPDNFEHRMKCSNPNISGFDNFIYNCVDAKYSIVIPEESSEQSTEEMSVEIQNEE